MKHISTKPWMPQMRSIRNSLVLLPALSCSFMAIANTKAETAYTSIINADRTIKGKVTDKGNNEGLPGVNVVVKGSSVGTTTDGTGNYTISVPDNGGILVFSFVGYVSQEVAVGNKVSWTWLLNPTQKH